MNREVLLVTLAASGIILVALLAFSFFYLRLWIQVLLTRAPVSPMDIMHASFRGCPPKVLVHAMIALTQRGLSVPVFVVENYYHEAAGRGVRVRTGGELADLIAAAKRAAPPAQPPAED